MPMWMDVLVSNIECIHQLGIKEDDSLLMENKVATEDYNLQGTKCVSRSTS